ncbi:MAG: restriction endonuclease subunit S, partial [Candidatus Marinimicrobia bacterium]|nr:restriction endonuclease subunit S [Candidatus Neomarinimicrobiota bacterium]
MNKSWTYGVLDDAVKKGSSNISLNKIKEDEGEFPVYGAKGYVQNVSFYQQETEYLGIIKDGAGIGRVSKHPAKSSILATMQYIIPIEGFDIQFVNYFLNHIDFEKYRTGSTIPHIYYKDYKAESFPLIPFSEQKRIVAKLDECFEAVDKARVNVEKNLNNAKELFQSQLNQIFSQKGDGWVEKKLREVFDVRDGTHDSPKYINEGIPFVTQKNITDGGLKFDKVKFINQDDHDKFYKRSNVAFNDIIISMIGANRGMACIVDDKRLFSIKNVGLIKSNEHMNQKYILYYLKSPLANEYVSNSSKGSAQRFIGLGKLRDFPIPF